MANPLMLFGAGLTVAGRLGEGIMGFRAGQAASLESIRAGVYARMQARQQAQDIREEGEEFAARQTAAFAKSGVVLDTGSPLLVKIDTLRKIERDALRTELYGEEAYRQKKRESEMLMKQARLYSLRSLAGAAETMITTYGQYQQMYKKPE